MTLSQNKKKGEGRRNSGLAPESREMMYGEKRKKENKLPLLSFRPGRGSSGSCLENREGKKFAASCAKKLFV